MIKFKVGMKGLEQGKTETKNRMKQVLMRSMFKMEELAVAAVPVDRGLMRQQITLFPQILAEKYVLHSRAPYSAAIEYGTRPFYAPIDPLKDWAGRVLGNENAAYAVRAKIAAEGITAHPFMRPALDEVQVVWLPQYKKEAFSMV